jgi:hypothetical protein
MIVLDEQLLGRGIEVEIARWYQGAVIFITDLRPYTIIKDDVIPELLRQQEQPTFITINEKDFWRKAKMNPHCCIVCFTLPNSRTHEIPQRLRVLFHTPEFDTKAKRMGKIIRVTDREISYYTYRDKSLQIIR